MKIIDQLNSSNFLSFLLALICLWLNLIEPALARVDPNGEHVCEHR